MKISLVKILKFVARAALLAAGVLPFGANAQVAGVEVKQIRAEKLANAPGKTLTAVVVNYAPGGKSGPHHHAGSVFAYALSGAIRSEVSTNGPAKIYQADTSRLDASVRQRDFRRPANAFRLLMQI